MPARSPRTRKPMVGDTVEVRSLDRPIRGLVIEDRGPIGVNGRRLLRLLVGKPETGQNEWEIPAEEVRVVRRRSTPPRANGRSRRA